MNIWAHRGCSFRYPENTLPAFRAATDYEISGIELDIQLTKDGEMVVIHDETVDRTTDGSGSVADFTLPEIKALRIPFGEEALRIPTAREALELLRPWCLKTGARINIELKNSVIRYEGMEKKILDLVRSLGLEDYVLYSSFEPDSVRLLRELAPEAETGALAWTAEDCRRIAEETGAGALHPFLHNVPKSFARGARPIRAWNTREEEPFFGEEREPRRFSEDELLSCGITDYITNCPEFYAPLREKAPAALAEPLDKGCIDEKSGRFLFGKEGTGTFELIPVSPGDQLIPLDPALPYRVFRFSREIPPHLIYEYAYQEESNWSSYLDCTEEITGTWQAPEEGYIRIQLRELPEGMETLQDIVRIERGKAVPEGFPEFFQAEGRKTARDVRESLAPEDLLLFLLADSHYSMNGNWEDSTRCLRYLASLLPPDAVIHLGDLTDGLLPKRWTERFSLRQIRDLKRIPAPLYVLAGNHDANYFRKNPETLSEEELSRIILDGRPRDYLADLPKKKIRMIFLDSFDDTRKERYGFSRKTWRFFKRSLRGTPKGWKVLIFSHVPPCPEIHVWSRTILRSEKLLPYAAKFQKKRGGILAWLFGHNHADQTYTAWPFPIIGTGCAKLEAFPGKKPEGAFVPEREQEGLSRVLFDALIVKPEEEKLLFFRFGAGKDREAGRSQKAPGQEEGS